MVGKIKRAKATWTVAEAKKMLRKGGILRSGGYLGELPYPHVRKYDDRRRRRPITISVTSFGPEALGGGHFYVTLKEDENPILQLSSTDGSNRPSWTLCWDDKDREGKWFEDRLNSESDAAHYIAVTFLEKFSSKTHTLVPKFKYWSNPLAEKIIKRAIKLIKERS